MIEGSRNMISSIHRMLGSMGPLAALVLVPAGAAHAQTTDLDGTEPPPVQLAFTPPSPSTVQPTAPAVAVPSTPTPPAGTVPDMAGYAPPVEYVDTTGATDSAEMIPPNVEGSPYAVAGGGYCYVGPHPADTRVVPGAAWDPTTGQHVRPYAPIDTRLFAYHDGCYYFTGDPRDFGYSGQTYAYYGAHPVLAAYGGGWCFMMGGHAHLWQPWSPYFTVVGPWYYWQGAYDPFFWTYWPYYSFYYRSYYPHYYGGGRFYRGGYRVAPPISRVPPATWRGTSPGRGAPIMRGSAPMQTNRFPTTPPGATPMMGRSAGTPSTGFGRPHIPGPTSSSPAAAGVMGPGSRPSFSPGPRPSFSPGPRPSFSPGPRPSFAPSRPSFAPSRPSFSPGPRPSFSAPSGGGFRGGGMGSHRGR